MLGRKLWFGKEISMRLILSVVAVTLTVLAGPSPSAAKGSPERIVIKADGESWRVEVTDYKTLKGFDPWMGQFIDWSKELVRDPPDRKQTYTVMFFMKWKGRRSEYDRGNLKMIYALQYCYGGSGEPGYVYLPGGSEKWGSVNPATIIREGHDGRWHYASRAWEALMKRLMSAGTPGHT